MSRRAIRKAFPQTDNALDMNVPTSDDSEPESTNLVQANQFLALNDSQESDVNSSRSPSPVSIKASSPIKQIKKKKKKRPKSASSPKNSYPQSPHQIPVQAFESLSVSSQNSLDSLLRCEARFFDSDRELRQLFGSSILRQEELGSSTVRLRRPVRSQRVHLRKTIISKSKDEWGHVSSSQFGLSMIYDPGLGAFRFESSPEYLRMQEEFESAAMTFDPQSIATLLQFQPWHCETLIQMGEIYRVHGEFALSSDLICRALFVFECSFHSKFDFLSGTPTCYLDPASSSSVSFLRALRRHMQFVGRKGCVRTAFEVSKLLLNLTRSQVPLLPSLFAIESLMHIAYYALRCNAFTFILDIASRWNFTTGLSAENIEEIPLSSTLLILPIWAYSVALAKFKTENEHLLYSDVVLVTKNVSKEDAASSHLIQQCFLLYPEALEPLLTKISQTEITKSKWATILSHRIFREGRLRLQENRTLQKLVEIFAVRCQSLWKEDEVIDWLVVNALNLLKKYDDGICASDEYDLCRNEFLQSTLCEISSKLEANEFSDSISTIPLADQGQVEANRIQEPQSANPFTGQNPVVAFLASLLPWVNVPDEQQ